MSYAVVSNPEFLKEGAAIDDFMKPGRIVIGSDDDRATLLMRAIYSPFMRNSDRLVVMDVRSAEFTKYAANAMLATRISFMNELARLADAVGADNVKALIRTGRQKLVLVERVVQRFGKALTGRTFAVWGLAFKPNTDDMREAPSRVIVEELTRRGARVQAYDPVAMPEAQRVLGHVAGFSVVASAEAALERADALLIVTEWREFRTPDFDHIKATLKQPMVLDGCNLYEPELMRSLGIDYVGIGRGVRAVHA